MPAGPDSKRKPVRGGMSIADSLLAELRSTDDLLRAFVLARIARDYGEGFARAVREEFEKQAKHNGGAQ